MSSLLCPRCKTDNPADYGFCQRCGYGLHETGSLSSVLVDPESWVGRTIGEKYQVLSVLGEGGFGIVFKVRMLLFESESVFALKLLRPDLSRNEQFQRRFLREARTAMELVHPYAIPVREFGQTEGGLLYFTMDFCKGEPLKTILAREGYMTVNRAIPLAIQVLEVMEAAHAREIIHRDLKPENIFIERDHTGFEEVRVGDFGLAKSLNGSAFSSDITKGGIVGTPRYMSPEQSRGEPLDHRSDLYAIGVVLFEMVTGQLPPRFQDGKKPPPGTDPPALANLREVIPPNLVVPRGVLEVLVKALEEKPTWRYQSAAEFREALEALPTYTPTYIEPEDATPRRSRGGRAWGLALVAILLVTSTLGFFFWEELQTWPQRIRGVLGAERGATVDDGTTSTELTRHLGNEAAKESDDPPSPEGRTVAPPPVIGVNPDADATASPKGTAESELNGGTPTSEGVELDRPGESTAPVDPQPQPAAYTEPDLGSLREWVHLVVGEERVFRKLIYGDFRSVEERTVLVRDPIQQNRLAISVPGSEEPTRRWFRVSDQGFSEESATPEGLISSFDWLLWDSDLGQPEEKWNTRGYEVEAHIGEFVRTPSDEYEDCILVVARKERDGHVLERRCYFKRGLGDVYYESRYDGVLTFSKERVVPQK